MSSTSNTTVAAPLVPTSRIIIFYSYVFLLVPSLVCSLLIFYYFICTPNLRKQASHRAILLLLIVLFIETLTDVPIRLYFLHKNTVPVHTAAFCLFWNWEASVLNIAGLHLIAFASLERHLIVFHGPLLVRYRFLLSIMPMIFSIVYPMAFYTGTLFGSWWCTNTYDYSSLACGAPCYLITSAFFPLFGILTHHALPVFVVLVANVMLIIRVLQQKNRMRRANVWQKNMSMCIQLLAIAFIYLILWLPQCVLFLMLGLGQGEIASLAGGLIYEYTGNFTSFTGVLCPFMVLASLSQLRQQIKEDFQRICRPLNVVRPSVTGQAMAMRRTVTMRNPTQENN